MMSRIRGLIRVAWSAGWTLTFLVALPLVLIQVVGWPLPRSIPSWDLVLGWLDTPFTTPRLVKMTAIVLWLAWAAMVLVVTLHLHALVRRPIAVRLRIASPLQSLAAGVVGGAVGATATFLHGGAAYAAPVAEPAAPVPNVPSTAAPAVSTEAFYLVQRGDWMSIIADRFLGDRSAYARIAALNPEFAQDQRFPDHIEPGWRLRMPPEAQDHGIRRHSSGPLIRVATIMTDCPSTTDRQPGPPGPALPDTTGTDTASTAKPPVPATSPNGRGAGDGVLAPPVPQSAPSSIVTSPPIAGHTPPNSAAPTIAISAQPMTPLANRWIHVSGGVISVSLAAGLLYAATRVWTRRRAISIASGVEDVDDSDDTWPRATLRSIRQQLTRVTPRVSTHNHIDAGTADDGNSAPTHPPSVDGIRATDLAGVGDIPVEVGLGLIGPAANDAARALLIAALTSGNINSPDSQGRALMPAATLTTLLGQSATAVVSNPRLTITPDLTTALTLIEEEIIRRNRTLVENESARMTEQPTAPTLPRVLPQLLLITDATDPKSAARIFTAISLGKAVEIGAVVIGSWAHGPTLNVSPDGTTDSGDSPRVGVLDMATAAALLGVLAGAHSYQSEADAASGIDANASSVSRLQQARQEEAAGANEPGSAVHKRVAVRILGEPAILGTDGLPVRGLRAKSLELLVYLATHRDGAGLSDIMEALWPDAVVRRAAERLSTCVANLRGVIRSQAQGAAHADSARARLEPVINTGGRYHLDSALLQVDWWDLQDAYSRFSSAPDVPDRIHRLRGVVAEATGGLAAGREYEWIETDREHTRRYLIKAYSRLSDLLTEEDPTGCHELREAACNLDPLSENLARQAMLAAAAFGATDAIRTRMAELRHTLKTAGLHISSETEELAANLLPSKFAR